MTVSRRGKRGTRAGHMIPESRNRRVLRNARLRRLTQERDDRPTAPRITKEQWVIECVLRVVGSKAGPGFVAADDVASDIILDLMNIGGFNWDEERIVDYCRRRSSYMVLRHLGRREQAECEFTSAAGDHVPISDMADFTRPQQEISFDAGMARRCLSNIPAKQRQALEILCDGGSPIDVAEEMKLAPWAAIRLIQEGREYVSRVDPKDG